MSVAELDELRAVAESTMVDTCTITRPGTLPEGTEPDPETLQYPQPEPVTVYVGKCEVDAPGGGSDVEVAGRDWSQRPVVVKIPVTDPGARDVRPGDDVHIDAALHNPALAGRTVTVQAVEDRTLATKRRLHCVEGG